MENVLGLPGVDQLGTSNSGQLSDETNAALEQLYKVE